MQNTNNNNGTAGNGGTSFLDSLHSIPNYYQLGVPNDAMGNIQNPQVVPEAVVNNPPNTDQVVPTDSVDNGQTVPIMPYRW